MKVLLIGLGKMWQFHLQNLLHIKEIQEIYAFDIIIENFKIKDSKIKYLNNLDDLKQLWWDSSIDNIDFIDIVAPTQFHKSYLDIFIKNNKHIFVEKPMVSNLDEFNKINKLIKETWYNKSICVWFIERFNIISKQFKGYISNYWNPLQIEIFRYNPASDRISDVNVTTDLMIHDIDLINYFFENQTIGIIWKNLQDKSSTVLLKVLNTNITLSANSITQQKIRQIKFYYQDKTIIWDLILWKIEIFHKPNRYLSTKWQDLEITYMLEEKILPKTNQLKEELEEFIKKINGEKTENISTIESSEFNMKLLHKLMSK